MPVTVGHQLTATTPDDPAYEIRPSHWNSNHAVTLSVAATEISGLFANSNGVSFGTTNGSITASHNGLTSQSNQAVSAANGSYAFQTLSLSNANGISFGTSAGSAITASHNALTSQSNQAFSAAGGSSAFQTLGFSNGNGVTFTNTNGSVGASVATTYRASNDAVGLNTAGTNVTWTVNSSGLSFNGSGYAGTGTSATNASITLNSNGLAISVAAPGAAAENNAINLLGANTSGNTTATGSTIGWSGINLTLSGTNGSQVIVSGPPTSSISGTGAVSISANGSTVSIGVPQLSIYGSSNTTGQSSSSSYSIGALSIRGAGIVSVGNSGGEVIISATGGGGGVTPVISANNGSYSFTTLSMSNANRVSFGTSAGSALTASIDAAGTGTTFNGANISGSITQNSAGINLSLSVAAPGAAAENNAINLLGANTAGNTTATGSTIGWSGVNLTLSGTNVSQIVVSAPATSSLVAAGDISISTNGSTITISRAVAQASFWNPFEDPQTTNSQIGNGSVFVQPMFALKGGVSLSRFDVLGTMSISSSSNSSHAGALSFAIGIYTRTGSTLSLASSGSQSYQWTNTSNNSMASISALRRFSIPMNANMTNDGDYWIALLSQSSTTNANWFTCSNARISQMSANIQGLIGEASNNTRQLNLGFGLWSTTSTALPASIAFTQIRGQGSGVANNALPFFVNANNLTV